MSRIQRVGVIAENEVSQDAVVGAIGPETAVAKGYVADTYHLGRDIGIRRFPAEIETSPQVLDINVAGCHQRRLEFDAAGAVAVGAERYQSAGMDMGSGGQISQQAARIKHPEAEVVSVASNHRRALHPGGHIV